MNGNNARNNIVGGMMWKMGERVLSQGVTFVVSVVLSRLLVPDDYGLIALVTVFINLANVFITSGFATSLVQKKDADDVDFSTIYFCSQLCSMLLYVVLFFCAPLVSWFYQREELTLLLRVFALQVPLSVFNSIQVAYISRHMQFNKVFFASVISAALSGALGVFLANLGFGVWALVAQTIGATVVNTLVMLIAVPWLPRFCFSVDSAKSLVSYGSRVLLADLSGTIFGELRTLIIGGVYSSADLAFYSKGQQLPTMITANLSNTIITVMFPALANQSDNIEQVKMMAKRSMKVLAYVLTPCMLGLAAVMEPLILFLFTEAWAPTIPYGQILCIGYCVGVFGIVPLQVLKAIGRSDVVLSLEFLKKPVYVVLLIIGVSINVFAIAVTMALYELYGIVINMIKMEEHVGYTLREQLMDLMPSFLLSIAMAVIVLLIPSMENLILTLVVKVTVGIVIYVGGSVLLKLEEFKYLLNMIQGIIRR